MDKYYDVKKSVLVAEKDMPPELEGVTYNLTVLAIKEWHRLEGDKDGTASQAQGSAAGS